MTQSPTGTAPPQPPAPRRRTAWAEGMDRLRAAATTEPGRLRIIGAVLAALVVVFGAVTAWQVSDRADGGRRRRRPQPAAQRGRRAASTARSPTPTPRPRAASWPAASEPRAVRERYERDIATASALLVKAAAATTADGSGRHAQMRTLNERLPVYTGLVEAARANNRQGLPLGGAYLRYANEQMRSELLPAATRAVRRGDRTGSAADYDDAEGLAVVPR